MVRASESSTAFAAFLSSSPMELLLRGMRMSARSIHSVLRLESRVSVSGAPSKRNFLVLRHHVRIGHREQQLAALAEIFLLAGDDFLFEVPGRTTMVLGRRSRARCSEISSKSVPSVRNPTLSGLRSLI
jgi:hypothetical protein